MLLPHSAVPVKCFLNSQYLLFMETWTLLLLVILLFLKSICSQRAPKKKPSWSLKLFFCNAGGACKRRQILQLQWVFLVDKSIKSSLLMWGSTGRTQALQVHVHVSGKVPCGEACLRSNRNHTSWHLSFQFSLQNCLHCTLLLTLFSYSVSPCSLLSLRLYTGHTLITEKLYSFSLDLCGFVSFLQNNLSFISLYNWCSYRSKPRETQKETFLRMNMLLFST